MHIRKSVLNGVLIFPLFLYSIIAMAQEARPGVQEVPQFSGSGTIVFLSEAPAETIRARSDQLEGIIDLTDNTFAFIIPVNSFRGFNSALQREHFNENYLVTAQFPTSTFTGNMVWLQGCQTECDIEIFAKGELTIHGITRLVTIPVNFTRKSNSIEASSEFEVALSDYDINIPLILEAKISPDIHVSVDVKFLPKSE